MSDRSSSGERKDISGPLAVHLLSEFGEVTGPAVVPDGEASVRGAIEDAARSGADVVFTTGGTGITTRDLTPEATLPLVEQRLYGIESLLRDNPAVRTSTLSRGIAGVGTMEGHRYLVVNAPGSTGGVEDAVTAVGPLLAHIVEQMHDGETLHEQRHAQIHAPEVTAHEAPGMTSHEAATWKIQHRGGGRKIETRVRRAAVSAKPIEMSELVADVEDPSAGAIVTFCGQVRNHDEDRLVTSIEYEAHPDADATLGRIARDLAKDSGACKVSIMHRSGHLEVGDIALGAAVSASHRGEAMRLLEKLVEEVKLQLPVWKNQEFADGSHEWTGSA